MVDIDTAARILEKIDIPHNLKMPTVQSVPLEPVGLSVDGILHTPGRLRLVSAEDLEKVKSPLEVNRIVESANRQADSTPPVPLSLSFRS